MNIMKNIKSGVKNKANKVLLNPLNMMIDENLMDITTTIGSFVIRSIRGKFQRSISFTIGVKYSDNWMEEALYGILYQYNNIKGSSRLQIANKSGMGSGSGMYYRLDNGTHNLKYRDWNILLAIQSNSTQSMSGRISEQIMYTIITYDLSPDFVTMFEKDMISNRNSLLKIRSDSSVMNVYQDLHESDGYTYWEKTQMIPKRRIGTVYLENDIKKQIVDRVNEFFASKQYYIDHGIAHNLKILLYGPPGPQPISTKIPTPNGYKLMGDLQVGDKVFTINGDTTEIEEIYDYENECDYMTPYVVEFSDGRQVRCGEGHKWPLIVKNEYGFCERVDRSVEELMYYGKIDHYDECDISLISPDTHMIAFSLTNPVEYEYQNVPINPWTFGALLSIGIFRFDEDGNLSLRVDSTDQVILDKINIDTNDTIVKDMIKSLVDNAPNKDSKIRKIPENYIYNSSDVKFALVKGFTDATVGRKIFKTNCLTLHTISSQVRDSLLQILYSLGISAIATEYDISIPSSNYPGEYFINNINLEGSSYFLGIMQCNVENCITKITKLTNVKERMRCIHVADENHLYLTDNFIPTCNSGKDSIAKMIASEWNRNIYYVTGGKDGKFIPNAITDSGSDVNYPLLLISDIDKYPYLINEPDIALDGETGKDEKIKYKQLFGGMINALDGVLSGEDRIIVMTTNHIEKFSKTILRPGRIDLMLEIGYVTPEVFRQYVWDFYKVALPKKIELKNKKLTVANMQNDVVFMKLSAEEFINKHLISSKKNN